jgi:transcription elongation factor Elf1
MSASRENNGTRFNCPYCNALYTMIIKTEMLLKTKKRIRECPRCGKTFETSESCIRKETVEKKTEEK